jgi:phage shock protein A
MTDTIASRVTRVISGGFHALLDTVENAAPEAAMAQAIREVDQAADEVRAELGRVESVKHLANSSLNKLNTQNETLASQVELAVARNDEDLARAGIARQVDIEDQIPVLQNSLHNAAERSRELEGYMVALLAKKREMESALQDFIAARAAAERAAPPNGPAGGSPGARAERAGAAFDRMLARQTGINGLTSPINPDASKLRDLQDLARSHRIDERLAALKAVKGGA